MSAFAADDFALHTQGRSGVISYIHGTHAIHIPGEMSGSERYDLLLAPLDLRRWRDPAGEPIPRAKQRDILVRLRQWLASRGTRSDIDLPAQSGQSAQTCVWHACQRMSIPGSTYCADRFDETLLQS
jgi:hypothetical protein